MDNLLCNEKWVSSPEAVSFLDDSMNHVTADMTVVDSDGLYPTKQESENALRAWLQKETSYVLPLGFVANVRSKGLVAQRIKAIQWFIKSKSRLGLSYATVFLAANYFDRFVSHCECQEWKEWMVELLSVACLSVASKFSETFTASPSLHEIQMQDLEHSFRPSTIQRMELMLTTTLDWQLSSVTPYTYLELLMRDHVELLPPNLRDQVTIHISELLLLTMLEIKLTEFRPSVVAASAVRNGLELYAIMLNGTLISIDASKYIDQDQRENLMMCDKLMVELLANPSVNTMSTPTCSLFNCGPSSPVTVLPLDQCVHEDQVDLPSLFEMRGSRANPNRRPSKRRKIMKMDEL